MKLEVGQYIRTDKGTIDKLNDENIKMYQVSLMGFGEKPIKASYNIIDLIEVGDYVNGCFVLEKDSKFIVVNGLDNYGFGQGVIPIEDIKSIVTKEQFESMEYKVENE